MDGGAPAQRREEGGGRREKSRRRWLGHGRLPCSDALHGEEGTDGGAHVPTRASHVDAYLILLNYLITKFIKKIVSIFIYLNSFTIKIYYIINLMIPFNIIKVSF
jgi:hypothetical protein